MLARPANLPLPDWAELGHGRTMSPMRIFVAGASGVVGRQLVPMLVTGGHEVTGTTRHAERTDALARAGATPAVVDATDRRALAQAVADARPEVVIHQLTDLAAVATAGFTEAVLAANARLRTTATGNLVAAAEHAGARRIVAQSAAWLYAPGPEPHTEEDPLGATDEAGRTTLAGVLALEDAVLQSRTLEGIVLRYGLLYGPGTGADSAPAPRVNVAAAARAAALAVNHGQPGVFNIVDDGAPVSNAKARTELGWIPAEPAQGWLGSFA